MESLEIGRKLKRNCDNIVSKKRLALVIVTCLVTFIYIVPYLLKWYRTPVFKADVIELCLRDRLTSFISESEEFNVNIGFLPPSLEGNSFAAYVGNGYIGLDALKGDQIYIRSGRYLALPTSIYPVLTLKNIFGTYRSAYAISYLTGIVHVFQCYDSGFYASFQYYAHRRLTSLFVQEIKLSNPTDRSVDVNFQLRQQPSLQGGTTHTADVRDGETHLKYNVTTGSIAVGSDRHKSAIQISLVQRSFPVNYRIEARSSKQIVHYTAISYSNPKKLSEISDKGSRNELEQTALGDVVKAAGDHSRHKELHARSWQQLWTSGFSIETSKAKDALNGDKINGTMYYVLSQVLNPSAISLHSGTECHKNNAL